MPKTKLPNDPLWPRAAQWLGRPVRAVSDADLALLGVPACQTSITPTGAWATPAAVRDALLRYSTYSWERGVDVATLKAVDAGDVSEPDGPAGEERVRTRASEVAAGCRLLLAVGGDNSITFPVVQGVFNGDLSKCGLVTIDAHHDLRDGETNGSPVRRLVEAGLPGERIVQIGIADFSNSPAYAARARDYGITVVTRSTAARTPLAQIVASALGIADAAGGGVFVDIDVDVCDRAVVPGCPSAAPGGLSAAELREIAFLLARDPRVRGMDITEIDATSDAVDQRTVRLAALLILEAAAGLAVRDR
ncbi:MAG TPA: arginase family protein [Coriobacteriia bacterium]|nr:arginase family protein [Coriobacteriia bacterium]